MRAALTAKARTHGTNIIRNYGKRVVLKAQLDNKQRQVKECIAKKKERVYHIIKKGGSDTPWFKKSNLTA